MNKFSELGKSNKKNNKKDNTIDSSILSILEKNINITINGEKYICEDLGISGVENFIHEMKNFIHGDYSSSLLDNIRYSGLDKTERILESKISSQTPSELKKHKERVKSLLKHKDEQTIIDKAEQMAEKIKSGEKAYYRAMCAEQMIADSKKDTKILRKIYNIFLFKSKKLGFKI